ncbi:hypothetical protein CDAR_506681, partial [Caerostris darwini]
HATDVLREFARKKSKEALEYKLLTDKLKQKKAPVGEVNRCEALREDAEIVKKSINSVAAELIFQEKNKKLVSTTIDLHGLHEDEAMAVLQRLFKSKYNFNYFRIITGKGNHSRYQIPVLRNAVERFCEEKNYVFKRAKHNEGVVEIWTRRIIADLQHQEMAEMGMNNARFCGNSG